MGYEKNINSAEADINKATKVMRQYLEIKQKHPDKAVFFRLGDFYETFYEDAILLSKLCDVTLTGRNMGALGRVPMAGIPSKSLEIYVKKLLDNDIKIVRTEQFKDENGEYIRKEVRIYTKGSVYENEFLEPDSNNYLCAICKTGDEYGFSYCDTSEGTFFLTYGQKDEIKREIVKIMPDEILMQTQDMLFDFKDVIENKKNVLLCPNYFKEGLIELKAGKYEAGYICANAILNYLLEVQRDFMPKLDDIKKYSVSNFMSLDFNTRRCLELSRNVNNFKKKGTLFWLLNKTKTPMGARLLKDWINSPLYNYEGIVKRQNHIKELCQKPNLRADIESFLLNLCDILRLSAKVSNKTVSTKELLSMAQALEGALKINEIIKAFESSKLDIDEDNVKILCDFANIVKRTIEDENTGQKIKDGANPQLDLLREDLKTLEKKLDDLVYEQKQSVCDDVSVLYNPQNGYYYEIAAKNAGALGSNVIIKQKLKTCVRYSDEKLLKIEEKFYSLKYLTEEIEKDIINKLREYARELTFEIRSFARCCAYLDVLLSLCLCALEYNFCPPEFNDEGIFNVKNGRHPLFAALKINCVPNDTDLNLNKVFLNILTGANMSGKSTYLKQNALIAILAQIGSFVPADYADISLCDKVFFHSLVADNLLEGTSTFFAEMQNIAAILNNCTSNSLILLDEPVKGTNPNDACALCGGILEYIITYTRAKTIAATHFVNLAKTEQKYNEALALCIGENEPNKIEHGVLMESKTFNTALKAGISPVITEIAKRYYF